MEKYNSLIKDINELLNQNIPNEKFIVNIMTILSKFKIEEEINIGSYILAENAQFLVKTGKEP